MNTTKLGIKDVAKELGLSEVYVRRMILKGKIATTKVEIAPNTFKHLIDREEVERWRKSVQGHSRRADGRSRFILYSTKEEFEKIQELLKTNEVEAIVTRQNEVKNVAN